MKKLLLRFHREENAQVLWIFALLAFILIGLMGLATDIGRIYVARAELGRSVDAAALAGAKQLPDIVAADAKARSFITENEPNANVNVEVYPNVPAQQVEVRAVKTVNTVFTARARRWKRRRPQPGYRRVRRYPRRRVSDNRCNWIDAQRV